MRVRDSEVCRDGQIMAWILLCCVPAVFMFEIPFVGIAWLTAVVIITTLIGNTVGAWAGTTFFILAYPLTVVIFIACIKKPLARREIHLWN